MTNALVNIRSSSLFRKLDLEDQMVVTIAVELVQSLASVASVCKTDKGETLCSSCLSVLGQKYTCDTAEPLEEVAHLVFLCKLADL